MPGWGAPLTPSLSRRERGKNRERDKSMGRKTRLDVLPAARGHVPEPAELAVLDLSCISVRLVLGSVLPLLAPGAAVVVLAKPQFEAGRREVPRGGVVRSAATQRRVVGEIEQFGASLGLTHLG